MTLRHRSSARVAGAVVANKKIRVCWSMAVLKKSIPVRVLVLSSYVILLLSACATAPYRPAALDSIPFQDRAQTQTSGPVTVSAAVPGPEEARALFDLPLYDSGIQPVWLKVENGSDSWIRYAPVGTDREYFSPQEIAYVHRGAFSNEGKVSMNHYLYEMAMPRRIPPGETRSGFVFTHAHPGTKAFNVDLFRGTRAQHLSFTFFIDVPGFKPDHTEAYFQELYASEQISDLDRDELRSALIGMDHQTRDRSGENRGMPVNAVVIGEPEQVLQALIRANWVEKPRTDDELTADQEFLFARVADVVFRKNLSASGGRNELRFWLSPIRENGTPVWMVQVTHHIGEGEGRGHLDPDLDDAAAYFLQDIWYGQGLAGYGWVRRPGHVPFDNQKQAVDGSSYFTDGHVAVMWLSGPAVSMLDVQAMDWDDGPGRVAQ